MQISYSMFIGITKRQYDAIDLTVNDNNVHITLKASQQISKHTYVSDPLHN